MKKNVIFRIAAIVLMCTLVTACFASSTFAKYTSKATGSGELTVAHWQIVAGKDSASAVEISGNPSASFDIAGTIIDDNAADAQPSDKICPGTHGSFTIYLKNESDVKADYTITLDDTGLADLKDVVTFTYDGAALNTATPITGRLDKTGANAEKAITIDWEWPFYVDAATDAKDTAHGVAPATYTLTADITVDQAHD